MEIETKFIAEPSLGNLNGSSPEMLIRAEDNDQVDPGMCESCPSKESRNLAFMPPTFCLSCSGLVPKEGVFQATIRPCKAAKFSHPTWVEALSAVVQVFGDESPLKVPALTCTPELVRKSR